ALRPEHAEESGLETNEAGRRDARHLDVRVGKFEIGILSEDDELVRETARLADPRLRGIFPFEPPQHGQEVEPPGLRMEFGAERHEIPLSPMRGGQRMISPRSGVRTTVWVKWLIATYSAKNRSRTAPRRNAPEPSKAFSSRTTVISSP